jgi:hypothetical protein
MEHRAIGQRALGERGRARPVSLGHRGFFSGTTPAVVAAPELFSSEAVVTRMPDVIVPEREQMLPPFIIEQIRKREEDRVREEEQPVLELPLPPPSPRAKKKDDEPERGVVIIDLM